MNNKKKLKENIIYNGLYQLFVLLMPVITIPYVTRIFTAQDLGINSYTLSIVQIFVTISFFGINQYGSREIAYVKDKNTISKTFWEIWSLQIIITIISYIFFIISMVFFAGEFTNFLWIQSFLIICNAFEVSWFFIGIEDFKNVVLRNTVVKLLVTSLIFIFINNSDQLALYMTFNIIGILCGNCILVISLRKHISKSSIDAEKIKVHVKKSAIFLLPQLSVLIYNTLDKTILGQLSNMDNVGYYDQSKRILGIAIGFITSVSTVLLPRMSSLVANKQHEEFNILFTRSLQYSLLSSFYVVAGIISVGPSFVVWFFGETFHQITLLFQLVAITGLFIPFSIIIGNALLIPLGKERVVVKASIYAAIISVVLNIALDSALGALGAVIGILLAEGITLLYRIHHARSNYNFNKIRTFLFQVTCAFVFTVGSMFIFNKIISKNFQGTLISGSLMTLIFMGILILLKNEIIVERMRIIQNKINFNR